jgi:hypothetical protein
MSSRRRQWEQRLASGYVLYVAIAGGVFVVTGVILAVMAIVSRSGSGDDGRPGEVDNRRFRATCPAGLLTVDFGPDEVRITREEGEFVASMVAEEAFVACAGALEDSRGTGFYVRGLRRARTKATRVECVSNRPIEVVVHPIFRYETDAYGGSLVAAVPGGRAYPEAMLIADFREDGRSYLYYRPTRCSTTGA